MINANDLQQPCSAYFLGIKTNKGCCLHTHTHAQRHKHQVFSIYVAVTRTTYLYSCSVVNGHDWKNSLLCFLQHGAEKYYCAPKTSTRWCRLSVDEQLAFWGPELQFVAHRIQETPVCAIKQSQDSAPLNRKKGNIRQDSVTLPFFWVCI